MNIKCYQCKNWNPMIQESETPLETYKQIIRDVHNGNILGACTLDGKWYPMFDKEECILKDEYKYLAEIEC